MKGYEGVFIAAAEMMNRYAEDIKAGKMKCHTVTCDQVRGQKEGPPTPDGHRTFEPDKEFFLSIDAKLEAKK